jgi:predicted Fe-S protein YdhL (DUF1289 family)
LKKTRREENGEVRSLCLEKCSLDQNKVCPECCRSIEEIVSWRDADDSMKRKILEAVKLRRIRAKKPGH